MKKHVKIPLLSISTYLGRNASFKNSHFIIESSPFSKPALIQTRKVWFIACTMNTWLRISITRSHHWIRRYWSHPPSSLKFRNGTVQQKKEFSCDDSEFFYVLLDGWAHVMCLSLPATKKSLQSFTWQWWETAWATWGQDKTTCPLSSDDICKEVT